jgi:hypothetical protein
MKQHQIGGGSAGNAPVKRNNTKSVVAWRGMHLFAKNGQWWCGEGMRQPNGATPIGGLAANAPANEETKSAGNALAK